MKILALTFLLAIATNSAASDPLSDAAMAGDNDLIARLVTEGAEVNSKDIATPLHWAVLYGQEDTVQLLLSLGADPSMNVATLGTPLHAAIRFGELEVLDVLLEARAETDVRDSADLTPLMVAVDENHIEAVQALIEADANVNAIGKPSKKSEMGSGALTALHVARARGFSEIERLLVNAGAQAHPVANPDGYMENADWMRGYYLAKSYCGECHIVENGHQPGSDTMTGPPLPGTLNSRVASHQGFSYSDAIRAFGGNWTEARLFSYALDPKLIVPGTIMDGSYDLTPQMIADMVAYFEEAGTTGNVSVLPVCPVRGSEVTEQIDCICTPPIGKGPLVNVKGSGPYSSQSHVCLSAVHAGVIGREGGSIRVVVRAPQASYVGSAQNGVYSSSRGSSKLASFDFQALSADARNH